jgi:hypothetical protein
MTTPVDEEPARGPLAWDAIRIVTVGLLTIVALVVSFLCIYLVTYVQEQRELSECYAAAFNELQSAIGTTTGAAVDDRRALRTLVTSLTDPEKSREQRQAALDSYVHTLDASEQARANNPLPNRTC